MTAKHIYDCGRGYDNLAALESCQINRHALGPSSTLARGDEIERDFYHLKAQEWACEVHEAEAAIRLAMVGLSVKFVGRRGPRFVRQLGADRPRDIIWSPDEYPLDVVAMAAEAVLSGADAQSRDVHQATYLLTTFRRAVCFDAGGASD